MKIVLQGYLFDANFGDMLYACQFYERCRKAGFQSVDFIHYKNYGIGPFCRQQLGYHTVKSLFSSFRADAFVIISGGSFWNDSSWRYDAKARYRRFILPALIFQWLRKPVYVLGVGGGPVDTPWLRKKMVKMLNKARVVTFRDRQTLNVFQEYGVTNRMRATADTALCIQPSILPALNEKRELEESAKGRKKLLLHIPDGNLPVNQIWEHVLPAVIRFLTAHPDYLLVISHDNIRTLGNQEKAAKKQIYAALQEASLDYYDYHYHDCWQMCSLINEMDTVITAKLHVGVVACSFGKCVIAFPVHREKTESFYRMIGESDRCVNMRQVNAEIAYRQLITFYDKPVHISEELRQQAEENLSPLDALAAGKN